MISPLSTFIVNCICSWVSLWQSFKEEFHSSQFAWSSRKRTNTSCKYKYRRVMWVWTFFSLHLIKFQKESWQIQNWLQPVSAHYWLEKTVEPRRKWKWFGHKTIWFGHKKYLSNREIRSPLHWYLIFGEFTCFLESVIEKRIFVNIDEYLLIIEYI